MDVPTEPDKHKTYAVYEIIFFVYNSLPPGNASTPSSSSGPVGSVMPWKASPAEHLVHHGGRPRLERRLVEQRSHDNAHPGKTRQRGDQTGPGLQPAGPKD